MPANRVVQTITGLSSTAGFQTYVVDWSKNPPINIGITGVLNSTAAAPTYNIEGTNDYTGSSSFVSTAATWFSSLANAVSSNLLLAVTVPVTALRANITAGSSVQTLTLSFISA
jgi:hypothetical protein